MILLTGAGGFLGKHLNDVLSSADLPFITLGRNISNQIHCDLSTEIPEINTSISSVIHVAGLAHFYPKTTKEKEFFFKVNEEGTKNLLQALEKQKSLTHLVFISTVAVYGLDSGENLDEDTALNGTSPYALSKIRAERLITEWCNERNIAWIILRLPLIAGNNPPGNLGKMITAIQKDRYWRIGSGKAQKSMVLASDVSSFICAWVQEKQPTSGVFHLTDGENPSFFQLEETLRKRFNRKAIHTIPLWLISIAGKLGNFIPFSPVNSSTVQKITSTLTFSDQKARQQLNWNPTSVIEFYSQQSNSR